MNNEVTKKELAGETSEELKSTIKGSYESLMNQTLTFLEISFPHVKGDDSENEKRFKIIRSKILRMFNDKVRELDAHVGKYVVFKLYDYAQSTNELIVTQVMTFKNKLREKAKDNKGGKDNG